MPPIICFGECMVELSRSPVGTSWALGFAGDTYNVAVYLKRLGNDVGYMTAVGEDHFSREMKAAWTDEGINVDLALAHPTRTPGLYAIVLDEHGERSFEYWRSQSAARAFFECRGAEQLMKTAEQARVLYLSGITLSLFDERGHARIAALAAAIRAQGGDVVFDSNYRSRGWDTPLSARRAMQDMARHVTIALPTLEDDRALFGDETAERCATRWLGWGVREVAVKLGAEGAYVATRSAAETIAPSATIAVKDTTGAGDSFNAAYISARLHGKAPAEAAATGNRLAATVVQHPGAIIRKVVMPSIFRLG